MVFVASGWSRLLGDGRSQVGTPDLPPHQLPDPSLEGGFSEFYRECSVPWGRGVLPEALGQALRGGGCGHTGRVSGSRSVKLGVLRLQRGEGVLLRESRGMDQAGPSVCPVSRAERSRRACRVGLRAQLCPILPDLTLLQAWSGVGGHWGGISLERPCQGNLQAGGQGWGPPGKGCPWWGHQGSPTQFFLFQIKMRYKC